MIALAREGVGVGVAARTAARCEEVAAEIGGSVLAVPVDVADPAACSGRSPRPGERALSRLRRDGADLDDAGRGAHPHADSRATPLGRLARLDEVVAPVLLTNAIRHASGEIEVAIERALNTVELHVRDRGTGFPDDFLDRALDRFSRPRGNPPSGGTGLGLSIVKTIAETHGGAAGVVNRADGGADVWLALPIAD